VPDPPTEAAAVVPKVDSRHRLAEGTLVLAKSVLGGYALAVALSSRSASFAKALGTELEH
jgi:hypothetical protein